MLSYTAVHNSKPKDKPYKLADEKSLYLLVSTTGKYWRFDYRFLGKRKTLAFGVYPDVSLADAREKRDAARKLLANEIDPSEHKRIAIATSLANSTNSFEHVAREWIHSYMSNKAESHKTKVIRRFELYLFPWIGPRPITEITAPELLVTIKRIEKLGILETAHRTLQTAGQVFRYAVQTGRAIRDITPDLKGALPATRTKHMAAFTEPKEVAQLLHAIDTFKGTFVVLCALRLGPLLFVRPGELRTAKWKDIDFERSEWKFLVSKTQTDHLVPLSRQAITILKEIQPLTGTGEYVFRGGHSSVRPMSEAAVNLALRRMGFDTKQEITGHGFRAMARTILHERLNSDPHVIEHQLAHKVPDALGKAYNRTKFLSQRVEMMQVWADYLDQIREEFK